MIIIKVNKILIIIITSSHDNLCIKTQLPGLYHDHDRGWSSLWMVSQRGTKEFAALTILRPLYPNFTATWNWIALQATLQCIVLQHSSLCTQFCAWSSWSVVRVSFWEWSSHLDWLHSLSLYPTTPLLHYSTTALYITSLLLHKTSSTCWPMLSKYTGGVTWWSNLCNWKGVSCTSMQCWCICWPIFQQNL